MNFTWAGGRLDYFLDTPMISYYITKNEYIGTGRKMEIKNIAGFLRVIKALSDRNRVKIVKLLQRRELCVCELQQALDVSQPTVSKHLKILEAAGLVTWRRQGLWVNYMVTGSAENPYATVLLANLRHWLEDDPEIRDLLRRLPEIHRDRICN